MCVLFNCYRLQIKFYKFRNLSTSVMMVHTCSYYSIFSPRIIGIQATVGDTGYWVLPLDVHSVCEMCCVFECKQGQMTADKLRCGGWEA